MDNTLTLVLAGGRCKRMDVICRHRAKPAVSFAGDARIMDFALSNCIHSGCKNIAVLIDYHRIGMSVYLNEWFTANGGSRKYSLLEPRYGTYQGNADAVYQNKDFLRRNNSDLVLVLAGDAIYKMDYSKMVEFHQQSGADVTIGITAVPIEQAQRFGVVTIDKKSMVMSFLEKPEIPQSNLISMSVYVFNKDLLIECLNEDAAIASSPHDFGHAILPRMVRQNKVAAYRFSDYWCDIGTMQSYYDANINLLPEKPSLIMEDTWPLLTRPTNLEPARISSGGNVINSLISPGCVIKGQVINSILSPGVWVEGEAVVRDSVIMANSFIGYHSVVDHCVLSEGTNIGRLCYIGFGGSAIPGEGLTVLGDQVTVPAHTAIGRNCKVLPHSGLSDFNKKVIPSDSIVAPLPTNKSFCFEDVHGGFNKQLRASRSAD